MKHQSTFIFQGWEILATERKIRFHYTLRHDEETFDFTESVMLPSTIHVGQVPEELLVSLLLNCHLMLGISYWKLFCSKQIEIPNFTLTKEQADFWNIVYTKGLGQFFYENKIDYRGLVKFPFDPDKKPAKLVSFPRKERSLLPTGGGKDSIVAAELLKKAKKPFSVVMLYTGVNKSRAQEAVARVLKQKAIVVKREIDKKLFELNKREDTYNGHVPAVAMHSFVTILLAAFYDYKYVIFANEESASYGNIGYLGEMMNHQWSKSLEFEEMLQKYMSTYITQDICYFSLLRPFSEIKIAQLFSKHSQYFHSFVSCNRGYRMVSKGNTAWCGECPKCAFVFAMLAAFLSKDEILQIFGKNLFNDSKLIVLYKELLGISAFKPFECVGTPEEVRLALFMAWEKGEWKEEKVMQVFVKSVLSSMQQHEEQKKQLFMLKERKMPNGFGRVVHGS